MGAPDLDARARKHGLPRYKSGPRAGRVKRLRCERCEGTGVRDGKAGVEYPSKRKRIAKLDDEGQPIRVPSQVDEESGKVRRWRFEIDVEASTLHTPRACKHCGGSGLLDPEPDLEVGRAEVLRRELARDKRLRAAGQPGVLERSDKPVPDWYRRGVTDGRTAEQAAEATEDGDHGRRIRGRPVADPPGDAR